jgi:hypothetical protein
MASLVDDHRGIDSKYTYQFTSGFWHFHAYFVCTTPINPDRTLGVGSKTVPGSFCLSAIVSSVRCCLGPVSNKLVVSRYTPLARAS